MFKFRKNDNKKKTHEEESLVCTFTLEQAEKLVCDNDKGVEFVKNGVRLHRSITDVLHDRTTLTFFVQFLETKNALPWVKFWLDLEAFKEVQNEHAPTISNSESNVDETDELKANAEDEVDFLTKAAEPLNQSLTDDEKSKICEKQRKGIDDVAETDSLTDLRKIQPSIFEDALRIYRKYLTNDSAYSVELPATILSKLSLALCMTEDDTDCDQKSNNLWDAFEDAQKHARDVMEKEYLVSFLESSLYYKYTVDVLTCEDLSLREILCSESALFYFMEFLEQESDNCKLPYLEFWLSANNFRTQTGDLTNLKFDALVIYEKWLSLQATSPLNFSNRVRTNVEERICSIDLQIAHCFNEALLIVETYLEKSCLKKFLKSQLFYKHLAEVMSKSDGNDKSVHINGVIKRNSSLAIKFPTNFRHRQTNWDSVEKKGIPRSISTQNTLLAGLDVKRNRNSTDLLIDSRQLGDPDLLYHRRLSGIALSFGRVDAYGRYERDFELPTGTAAIPSNKSAFQLQNKSVDLEDTQKLLGLDISQSRFKSAVRRLVHLPEDSQQQEIAWQVAQIIVKDVTNITMAHDKLT